MNWADYVIIAVLVLSVLMGLWRGLISAVIALATWVAAVWLAWMFGSRVAMVFRGMIHEPTIRIILGYVLCFVGVLIVGALVRFGMDKLVKSTGLSGTDRMLGMLFGLARGAVLVTLAVFLLGYTAAPHEAWWHRSQLLPAFVNAANWLDRQLPPRVHRYLQNPTVPKPHFGQPTRTVTLPNNASTMSASMERVAPTPQPAGAASAAGQSTARVASPAHSRDN